MNDAELDRLVAAAATVSDAEVAAWDLAAPEADLREEIMSTTDTPVPDRTPDRSPAAGDPEPEAGAPIVIDLTREDVTARRRGAGRRNLVAVGAVAATVAVVGALAVAVGGGTTATTDPGAGGTGASSPGARPATPDRTVTPEDVAAVEPLPTLSVHLDGWEVALLDPVTTSYGELRFGPAGTGGGQPLGVLYVDWAPAGEYDERVSNAEADQGPGTRGTVMGQPAVTFSSPVGEGEAVEDPSVLEEPEATGEPSGAAPADAGDAAGEASGQELPPGARHNVTIWVLGDHVLQARGLFASQEEYDEALAALQEDPPEAWLAALPAGAVLPSERIAAANEMVADIPVPTGLEFEGLATDEVVLTTRYHLGAEVTGAVACGWIGSWVAAREAGDELAAKAAVDAMATSHDWAVLAEMNEEGDWPEVVWELADAMPTDAPVSGGRPLTVAESYDESLRC